MQRRTGRERQTGYRTKPKALDRGILVPEAWYDARLVWAASEPKYFDKSKLRDEPFKRYFVSFEIVQEDGSRGKVFCSLPWPLDDISFSRKSAVWCLADMLMGEGYMNQVSDPKSDIVLDTSAWLGRRLQIYPQQKTVGGVLQSRVVIDTFKGEPHIRVPREVDITSTRLLWEKARQLGATRDLMTRILREFSILTPDPKKWLLTEQRLINFRLNEYIKGHQRTS